MSVRPEACAADRLTGRRLRRCRRRPRRGCGPTRTRPWRRGSAWGDTTMRRRSLPSDRRGAAPASGGIQEARSCLVGEGEPNAAVLPALFLDLGDRNAADLGGRANMRAAAWLQVDGTVDADGNQTHLAASRRRLDAHGADEPWIVGKLLIGNPAEIHRMIGGDERAELFRQVVLVDDAGFADVEVQAALLRADRSAGHG